MTEPFDTAGFDPQRDEAAYWAAARQLDGGDGESSDASRAEIMQRYRIRDRAHWSLVKQSCDQVLEAKYGSYAAAIQQYSSWLIAQIQVAQQAKTEANIAAMRRAGGFEPVEGISLEIWAARNAALIAGAAYDDVLKGAGVDRARWERADLAWKARMQNDTTFAIATVYGNAFQAASRGRYAANVRDAIAARTENRDLAMPLPLGYAQFFDILMEQTFASLAGQDAVAVLDGLTLSLVDWTDLGTVMGYQLARHGGRDATAIAAAVETARAKATARWPDVNGADVDIQF